MVYIFSEHFSHFHFNFWPGEVVILFSHFFLIPPNDPLSIVCAIMGQISSVVVVPVQVHLVAGFIPPSSQVEKGTIVSFNRIIVSVLGGEGCPTMKGQRVSEVGGRNIEPRDGQFVQRTWSHLKVVVEGNIGSSMEVL